MEHQLSKLSNVCYSSNSKIHNCFSVQDNAVLPSYNAHTINIRQSKLVSRWISTGTFHSANLVNKTEGWIIGSFNKCSMLPIVQIMVVAVKLTAIIDTGAARCLLSNALADIIWGDTWRSRVNTNQVCYLRDVNANPVPTIGTLHIDFQINTTSFKHCFIIFQSESNEVLLGFDFLRKFQIGVFPNLGLIFENYPVNKVANILPSVFPLHISQSITLQAKAQQVVEVHISIPDTPDLLPMLAERNVLAHSQILEPDVQWEYLSVFSNT